jgi:peptidoglycan/xylan/chitin deacetylase (PgdA/CDA1 family)
VKWQDGVATADAAWTEREMRQACERYSDVFGHPPQTHGAAGWQMNRHALRLTQRLGFQYASDGRGDCPHWPVVKAEIIRCPQLPTTLPTLDELIGADGMSESNVADHLLALTARSPRNHVYTLHAELEGRKLAPVFETLLNGWRAQGYDLVATRESFAALHLADLPMHEVEQGTVPGRSGGLMTQGKRFLE